jgi:hypothetical protein
VSLRSASAGVGVATSGAFITLAAAVLGGQPAPPSSPGATASPAPSARPERAKGRWYKGNTHTHTLNTDGDSTAEEVVRWYRQQKYHFVVISDHDMVTPVEGLNALYGAPSTVSGPRRPDVPSNPFLVIPGEEVTDKFSTREASGEILQGRDLTSKELHVTAVNLRKPVVPQAGTSVADVLQRNVDAIRAAGAFPIVNHPNFVWALSAGDLSGLRGVKAFELWNAHTQSHNQGAAGRPGTEEMWDQVLSAGTLLYGVAADDSHMFKNPGVPTAISIPGRAWIMVRATDLTAEAIVEAMERGDFYASTGVELASYEVTPKTITIAVKPSSRSKYDVRFVGKGGRVLKEIPIDPDLSGSGASGPLQIVAPPAVYEIRGDEGYVRARITESNGNVAWTQPVLVPSGETATPRGR